MPTRHLTRRYETAEVGVGFDDRPDRRGYQRWAWLHRKSRKVPRQAALFGSVELSLLAGNQYHTVGGTEAGLRARASSLAGRIWRLMDRAVHTAPDNETLKVSAAASILANRNPHFS